jgi:ABC-2 type transport system ATP-binding protein
LSDQAHMIEAFGLTKRFGRFVAVDSLDLAIPRGQVVGLLGPNGAGKSTTIRMLAGFLPPSAGVVLVDGLDMHRHGAKVRPRIGYLPEAAPSYGEMRVVEFLKYRARLYGIERGKRRQRIETTLQRCWLDDVRRRPIHQLSKGYRQRVGLAAALLHQPPVIILDEPTVGLDPTQIRETRGLIRELAGRHTIVLSTHILPEVELTCDRIVMIARGRVRAAGTLDELRAAASRTIRYRIETDVSRAENLLREHRGVADVECIIIDGKWRRCTVSAREDAADLREALAAILSKAGGTIRELQRETPTLEHLFIQAAAEAEMARPHEEAAGKRDAA